MVGRLRFGYGRAAAEHLVEGDGAHRLGEFGADEGLLGADHGALARQNIVVGDGARLVAGVGEFPGLGGGLGVFAAGREFTVHRAFGGEGVGDFPEGGLNGLFVVRDGNLLADLGGFKGGDVAAAREDRKVHGGREGPEARVRVEEVR